MRTDGSSRDQAAADRAWEALRHHGIIPLPPHFELWFAYYRGDSPELTRRLSEMIASNVAFTPDTLDELYHRCIAAEDVTAEVLSGAKAVQEIAATIVAQLGDNQAGVNDYSEALALWAAHLQQQPSVQTLLQAIDGLAEQTTRAHARNAVLEQQIASSVTRVSELQQRLTKAEHTATTDPLTGLANRGSFEKALRRAMAQARDEAASMCLLMIDIDHFKRINDSFGHPVGDLVIRLVAKVISDNVKGRDCAARYGGEEFAVVLFGAGLDAGAIVGEQIRQSLARLPLVHKPTKQQLGTITVSVGVSSHHRGDKPMNLVNRADRALYAAKHSGRNLVCTEAMLRQGAVSLTS